MYERTLIVCVQKHGLRIMGTEKCRGEDHGKIVNTHFRHALRLGKVVKKHGQVLDYCAIQFGDVRQRMRAAAHVVRILNAGIAKNPNVVSI